MVQVACPQRFRHNKAIKHLKAWDSRMAFDLYMGGAMALWLTFYLVYALINPDKF